MDVAHPGHRLSTAAAAVLRGERSAQKVTYDQLAERSGLSRRTVIRLLQGDRSADLAQLSALSGALSMSASEVLRQAEVRLGREAEAAEMERQAAQQSDVELPPALTQQGVTLAARRMRSRGKALRAELDALGEESQESGGAV